MNAIVNPTNVTGAAPVNILSQRAMLIRLNLTAWSARKLDRKITDKVNQEHGAAHDAGRYNKLLISKDALQAIEKIDNAARSYFYSVTSPWHDEGARILSAAHSDSVLARLREYRLERESAVASFLSGYPDYVMDAKARLNGMFNAADYPAASDIGARFTFRVTIDPVPDSGDFRVELAAEQADDIRRDIESRAQAGAALVTRDCFDRIAESVGRMAERLRSFKPGANGDRASGVFRDSLVDNVRELAGLLPALNVTGDPALRAIADRMARELCGDDATVLRENQAARESVARAAESILQDVTDYLA